MDKVVVERKTMADYSGRRVTGLKRDDQLHAKDGQGPGKHSLTEMLPAASDPVQRKAAASTSAPVMPTGPRPTIHDLFGGAVQRKTTAAGPTTEQIHASAQRGIEAAAQHGTGGHGGPLPHHDTIQRAFGRHDVSHIVAHTDATAAEGARAMGAEAFAVGDQVAFADAPGLHVAAHEAAHVIQQRGGVRQSSVIGRGSDAYEQHAEEVAERVTSGRSAEALLDRVSGGGGGATPVVQRYSLEEGHRISSKRAMATEDQSEPKRFFAKPETINRSNAILEGMNSKVTLEAGGDAPEKLAGMKLVTPAPRDKGKSQPFDVNECIDVSDRVTNSGQTHAVYQQPDGHKTVQTQSPYDLSNLNKVIELLTKQLNVAPQDIVNAQEAMNPSDDDSSAKGKTFDFSLRGTEVKTDTAVEANNAIKPHLQNRNLRVALLLKVIKEDFSRSPGPQQQVIAALEQMLSKIELNVTEEKDDDEVKKWEEGLRKVIKQREEQTRAQNSQSYAQLDGETKSARSQQLGVNEFAQPDVGEAYGVMSTRERTDSEKDKWSFHFAAVVARDEDDSVTLENYNRNKGPEGNDEWYFDMQGPREQSFHDKHKDTVADGVTLRMGQAATPDMRIEFKQRIEEKLRSKVSVEIEERIEKAVTRAELAAIYADAISGH